MGVIIGSIVNRGFSRLSASGLCNWAKESPAFLYNMIRYQPKRNMYKILLTNSGGHGNKQEDRFGNVSTVAHMSLTLPLPIAESRNQDSTRVRLHSVAHRSVSIMSLWARLIGYKSHCSAVFEAMYAFFPAHLQLKNTSHSSGAMAVCVPPVL